MTQAFICCGCSSVKRAAAKMEQRPINVLVNNASVAAPKEDLGRKTVDGLEVRPEQIPHVLRSCKALLQIMSVQ